MTVTIRTLAAIWQIAKYLMHADGSVTDEEIKPVYDFYKSFGQMNEEIYQQIVREADELSNEEIIRLIDALDEAAKQQLADLFASIVVADGEVHKKEYELYQTVTEACGLPAPTGSESAVEAEETTPADPDDEIVPAFMIIRFDGMTSFKQSNQREWGLLEPELANWIGGKRVEIVRFTKPLNALSEQLNLNERHLVFMIARGAAGTTGDNMPATLLYGGGYPLYGDIIIALETDGDYEIEGFATRSLFNEALNAVNAAVDGLLRTE